MTSRVTRNSSTGMFNENKMLNGKTSSNIPLAKRKAAVDDLSKDGKKPSKRAALGDLTNANGKNVGTGDAGKAGLKKQMKKGLNTFVEKGKNTLRNTGTRASLRKKGIKEKDEKKEDSSVGSQSSNSSEEETVCVMDTTETEESVDAGNEVFVCPEPFRAVPPEGILDFDGETMGDPMQNGEYVMETFQYYKDREAQFQVGDYISQQLEITEAMRAILVDWLVEVQESFELNHETLYTAVKITDIYLSKKQVKKEELQLVGATACLIACKVDERIPPLVDDFLYVCDDAYNRDELMRMERKMLKVVGFDLGYSLSYRYVRRYGRVCRVNMPVLTLARYILEMSLMEYSLNTNTSEAKLAASSLVLAMKMKGLTGFTATLEYYSGFKLSELEDLFNRLIAMLKKPSGANLKTIKSKYSHKVFHEVAVIPVPEGLTVQEE